MPALKNPVVVSNVLKEIVNGEGVTLSGNDFGEFHPTAQLRSISDLPKGGVFKGVDFNIPMNRQTALKYINMTERMKPSERIRVDTEIMRNRDFAMEVFKICSL